MVLMRYDLDVPVSDIVPAMSQYLDSGSQLHLADGVEMELVLVPAGRFTMGVVEPCQPVLRLEYAVLACAAAAALAVGLFCHCLYCALGRRSRLLTLLTVIPFTVSCVFLLCTFVWYRDLKQAWNRFEAASVTFRQSGDDEKPAHEVEISRDFYMGKYEVTQLEMSAIMGWAYRFVGDDIPYVGVTWDEAMDFCRRVSAQTGFVVRLPTEAEWEYACRAGTTTNYHTGDSAEDLKRAANWAEDYGATHDRVGLKVPNAFGLCDMHGNIAEWCADWYSHDYYSASPRFDPTGPASGSMHVARGGGSLHPEFWCRSHSREPVGDVYNVMHYGFRVVVEVPHPERLRHLNQISTRPQPARE
jgi:formylglycine-generating enzyme required for sulfatase activity